MRKFILLFISALFICTGATAQTETTQWYIDGELYATTSCESGDDIDMPTLPERFGYTFSGWESAIYDMSTLDTTINGSSIVKSGTKWRVTFSYGTVYGESLCSTTSSSGNWYTNSDIDTETGVGRFCYCRVTEFIPTNDNKIYEPVFSRWVFRSDEHNDSDCERFCTNACSEYVNGNASFKAKLYGIN